MSGLILGGRNADFLGAPDSRLCRAAVLGTAVFAAESARRVIPGATRLFERLGRRQRTVLVRRLVRERHGDRSDSA